ATARQRAPLPDLVGVLRPDQAWGPAQLSAATHELNIGHLSTPAAVAGGVAAPAIPHTNSELGSAAPGSLKFSDPFIAPGDALCLHVAYDEGSQLTTLDSV
ncbi:porin, partial [Methylobacterium sp. J-026]|nr:porin [Methylobacterium sp. J-026]